MTTTACRACGGVVSLNAATCPHCGEGHPSGSGRPPRGSRRMWLLPAVIAAVALAAAAAWLVTRGSDDSRTLTAGDVERELASGLPGSPQVFCPGPIPLDRGKIVDCVAWRRGEGPRYVRVTQDDDEGHYSFKLTGQNAPPPPKLCREVTSGIPAAAGETDLALRVQPAGGTDLSQAQVEEITRTREALLALVNDAAKAGCSIDGLISDPLRQVLKIP